ncbi:MAG: hypothetical protein ABSG84_18175 [Acidobacteriaceae bacterium]|jgi:hypothetical protein
MKGKTTRRTFLKMSAAASSLGAAKLAHAAPPAKRIAIVSDDDSPLVNNDAVRWATQKLRDAITPQSLAKPAGGDFHILIAPVTSPLAKSFPGRPALTQPEATALVPGPHGITLLATGSDIRGITYAVLELTDRINSSDLPMLELQLAAPLVETTPNKVRSVARAFCSEIEDKAWFYDRAFWTNYLDTLAAARFNRFNFALGFGWDFPRGVTGDYFHFPYPYLVEVPGYEQVHVEPALEVGERQRNLGTLKFIAAETARRGMDFQLGIWTHAYEWTDSPHSDHHIVGLTPEIHAAYCRDALAAVLRECPPITGLTMRIHGESGIPEGSYSFWETLFEAIPAAHTPDGRPRIIEIDMHAKGLDQRMVEIARATGMPVKAGAKYWAEHLGLGYQQADIRANEYPRAGVTGTFAVSSGLRNFTRYGYGDFYQQDIGVELLYRVWPGTQRHLLWGDPALAAGYGRAANFCGAAGMELCEPLTFKGREGSGHPGGRDAYADATLGAPHLASEMWEKTPTGMSDLDTAKFTLTYLTWGRYLYNPDTAPDFYHRVLKRAFGPAGPALETALAASSRILPLVTTAWCPSASNHEFWPEMLTPVSILPYTSRPLYTDSPAPHNVSVISPLDPQLFTTIDQHAKDLIAGTVNARYNTSEVIQWLETMVATSAKGLATARDAANPKHITPEFRRSEEDILILNGLGSYYAKLFRAALLYSIYELNNDAQTARSSLGSYRKARDAWAGMATLAKSVYAADVSYGSTSFRRGHWADRLPAIDADLDALEKRLAAVATPPPVTLGAIPVSRPILATIAAMHAAPESFHPGSELALTITTPSSVTEAILWYRHVNHGERWLSTPMQQGGASYSAAIPAAYTDSPYPLQYYFELHTATAAILHPAFNPTLCNQPYYAIYKRT